MEKVLTNLIQHIDLQNNLLKLSNNSHENEYFLNLGKRHAYQETLMLLYGEQLKLMGDKIGLDITIVYNRKELPNEEK